MSKERVELVKTFVRAVSLLSISLIVLALVPAAQAAGEKANGKCTKAGKTVSISGIAYVCKSVNGSLLWTAAASTPQAPIPAGTISSASPGSASNEWVKWDKASCSLVAATAPNAFPWRADLRPNKGLKVGYGTQNEGIAVVDLANASMKSNTEAIGGDYLFTNFFYPDAAKLIDGINSLVTRKADVVVSWNLLAPSMDNMMSIYKKACIPVIQVSSKATGAVLFGPDNALVGTTEGEGLVAFAKSRNWTNTSSQQITALAVTAPSLGASINQRSSECVAAIKKAFPNAKTSTLILAFTTTADGQSKMADWLTANPMDRRVLACTEADTAAFGIANAAGSRGRLVGVGGVGGSKNPGGKFVGTVDFGFKNYGSFLVPLAQDLAAGRPVPAVVAPALKFVTTS